MFDSVAMSRVAQQRTGGLLDPMAAPAPAAPAAPETPASAPRLSLGQQVTERLRDANLAILNEFPDLDMLLVLPIWHLEGSNLTKVLLVHNHPNGAQMAQLLKTGLALQQANQLICQQLAQRLQTYGEISQKLSEELLSKQAEIDRLNNELANLQAPDDTGGSSDSNPQ